MRRLIEYLKMKMHIGHTREIAEHERQREAADQRYARQKAAEEEHVSSCELLVAEIAAMRRKPITNGHTG